MSSYDARCTLTHDGDDRDMGCYMCQTYGNVHDAPHAAAIVRDHKRARRIMAAAMGMRRRIAQGERFSR